MQDAVDSLTRSSTALKATHERMKLLVDNVTDYAIFMLDVDGCVSTWNKGAQRLKGYKAEEIIGRHFSDFYLPDAKAIGWPQRELELATEAGRFEDEGWRVRKDGTRFWANVIITALRDEQGALQGFAKITRDLTERRANEQALQQARDQLERRVEERTAELAHVIAVLRTEVAERRRLEGELRNNVVALEESDRNKNVFLATLAHELRNPLAPVRTATQLIRMKLPDDPSLGRSLDIIERQVRQMVRLIDDLLDLSRITRDKIELKKEPVALADVVQHAIETSRPSIDGHGQSLIVTLPDRAVTICVDGARVAQVLSNLLHNASKFTDPGGQIRLSARRDGSAVVISVQDDGIGIKPEMLARIFDLFAQADQTAAETHGGLGIGLALSKRLVEMHGGTIEARSEGLGRGAEFLVRLPVEAAAQKVKAAATKSDNGGIPPLRRRILIADDNIDAADSLQMVLTLLGSDVQIAADGIEALIAAESFQPDIILLDLGMPGLDGFETARRIRQQPWGKSVLLVAMTGWGQEEHRRRSREAGFNHHLVKPVDPQALRDLLAVDEPENLRT